MKTERADVEENQTLIEQAQAAYRKAAEQEREIKGRLCETFAELDAKASKIKAVQREILTSDFDKAVVSQADVEWLEREHKVLTQHRIAREKELKEAEAKTRAAKAEIERLRHRAYNLRTIIIPKQSGVVEAKERDVCEAERALSNFRMALAESRRVTEDLEGELRMIGD